MIFSSSKCDELRASPFLPTEHVGEPHISVQSLELVYKVDLKG